MRKAAETKKAAEADVVPIEMILPGFEPVSALWAGEAKLFPSDQSARWYLRQEQKPLAEAGALAMWQGRYYFHRERFLEVVRAGAVERCRARVANREANAA